MDEASETASYILEGIVWKPTVKARRPTCTVLAQCFSPSLPGSILTHSLFIAKDGSRLALSLSGAACRPAENVNLAFMYLELTPVVRKSAKEALVQFTH